MNIQVNYLKYLKTQKLNYTVFQRDVNLGMMSCPTTYTYRYTFSYF